MKGKVKQGMKLVKICMKKKCFTFRNEYYKQLKGAPMGNDGPNLTNQTYAKVLKGLDFINRLQSSIQFTL